MKGKIFLLLFLFSVTEFPPYACTAFILDHGGKKLLAKNLDWPVAEGYLFINRKGEQKLSLPLATAVSRLISSEKSSRSAASMRGDWLLKN